MYQHRLLHHNAWNHRHELHKPLSNSKGYIVSTWAYVILRNKMMQNGTYTLRNSNLWNENKKYCETDLHFSLANETSNMAWVIPVQRKMSSQENHLHVVLFCFDSEEGSGTLLVWNMQKYAHKTLTDLVSVSEIILGFMYSEERKNPLSNNGNNN